eukprot:COSAG02_NODE_5855_length_3987_cov_2.574331_2_plen_395_part_00
MVGQIHSVSAVASCCIALSPSSAKPERPPARAEFHFSHCSHKPYFCCSTIVLDFSIFNDNKNMFGSVRVEFDVLNTGLVESEFHMMSLKVQHYHTPADFGRSTGELVLLGYLAVNIAIEFHEFQTLGFVVHFSSGWNYVDFCRIGYSFMAVLLWIRIVFHDSAMSLQLPLPEGVNYIDFDELISLHTAYSEVTALLVVMCLLSVMKYLRHSRRYGIMIMTIEAAAADLLQFQITFTLVMVTFAVMGMQMFGHILAEFSDFSRAYQTLMTMTTGEYGYANVSAYPGGYMFYFLYLGLVFFLLVQMFMAIILDNYAVVMTKVREQDENRRYKFQYSMTEEITAAFWRALPFTYNPEVPSHPGCIASSPICSTSVRTRRNLVSHKSLFVVRFRTCFS